MQSSCRSGCPECPRFDPLPVHDPFHDGYGPSVTLSDRRRDGLAGHGYSADCPRICTGVRSLCRALGELATQSGHVSRQRFHRLLPPTPPARLPAIAVPSRAPAQPPVFRGIGDPLNLPGLLGGQPDRVHHRPGGPLTGRPPDSGSSRLRSEAVGSCPALSVAPRLGGVGPPRVHPGQAVPQAGHHDHHAGRR